MISISIVVKSFKVCFLFSCVCAGGAGECNVLWEWHKYQKQPKAFDVLSPSQPGTDGAGGMGMTRPVSMFIVVPGSVLPCGWSLPTLMGVWEVLNQQRCWERDASFLTNWLAQETEEQMVENNALNPRWGITVTTFCFFEALMNTTNLHRP